MYYAGATGIAFDAVGIMAREQARMLHQHGATPEQVAATGYHYTGVPGQYARNGSLPPPAHVNPPPPVGFNPPPPVSFNPPPPVHVNLTPPGYVNPPLPVHVFQLSQEHVPPFARPENPYAGFHNTQTPERPSWLVPAVASGVVLAVTAIGVSSYYAKKYLGGDTP